MGRLRALFCLIALAPAVWTIGCGNPADGTDRAVVRDGAVKAAAPLSGGKRFVITEDSSIGFTGSKVTGSHNGGFRSFEGEIQVVDGDPLRSSVEVTIDATSLWADREKLTGHLRSPDFFDVETHPTAAFGPTDISTCDQGGYTITGNLTLRGVTKSISFPARIAVEDDRVTAGAKFVIMRNDFGIAYAGAADDLIRNEVIIRFEIVAVPAT